MDQFPIKQRRMLLTRSAFYIFAWTLSDGRYTADPFFAVTIISACNQSVRWKGKRRCPSLFFQFLVLLRETAQSFLLVV